MYVCVFVCAVAYFGALRRVNKLRTAVDLISKRANRMLVAYSICFFIWLPFF